MGLESIFRLSLIMNMVDQLTGPLSSVTSAVDNSTSRIQSMNQTFGDMTKTGSVMAGVGMQITGAALAPVEATFDTRKALGELSSLGVEDLEALEAAARSFSDTWAGTTKSDFITAAYDIKSGISSLTDEGIAGYTEIAGITAKATKASIEEMTSLFASGYGIYKNYYDYLDDFQFAEMFSAGIAESVRAFKTSGSGMANAIQSLGASATNANVPLEEQLAILGMMQATMGGSEAGTKYNAFLRSAAKGGENLGLAFTDADNQLKALPEILDLIRGKFGDTIDAAEKMELQKAFGDALSVQFIDLLYNKTDDLQDNILSLYDAMGGGIDVATQMADAINSTEPDQYLLLQQQIQNIKETAGNSLLPTVNELLGKGRELLVVAGDWVQDNQELVRVIMLVVLAIGGFLTVAGTMVAVVGGIGLVFTKGVGQIQGFIGVVKKLPGMLDTVRLYGMYAGDGIKKGFALFKGAGATAVTAVKNVAVGMAGMAKQAITTAVTAMPGLISSVWGFTAALLANPITWIVIAIIALIAIVVILYNKCEWFRDAVNAVWGSIKDAVSAVWNFLQGLFSNMKAAYEEHGGGLKGIAAAALAGLKGIYEAGFGFLDNLTGGRLSDMKAAYEEHGGGLKGAAAAAWVGVKAATSAGLNLVDRLTGGKLTDIKNTYQEHGGGLKGIAAVAMIGIRDRYEQGFNALDTLTGGRLSSIRDKFTDRFNSMKETVSTNMQAAKDYAGSKLGEMQTAYESHGGGIQGTAAAAWTGIRAIAEGEFTLLDKLTGGRLSSIRDKFTERFSSMKESVSINMQAAKDFAGSKLSEMQTAYESHGGGIQGAAAAAWAGIRAIAEGEFNLLDKLTGGRLSSVRDTVANGIQNMKEAVTGKFQEFKDSGRKLIETFTEGIKSALSGPVDAVKGGLSKIREMLPFSDAKTGPLSTLTLSGTRTMSTLAEGMQIGSDLPAQAAAGGLDKVQSVIQTVPALAIQETMEETAAPSADIAATREQPQKVSLREVFREIIQEKTEKEINNTERTGGVHIENLEMPIDLKKLKDLNLVLAMLQELEDYRNSNGLVLAEGGAT